MKCPTVGLTVLAWLPNRRPWLLLSLGSEIFRPLRGRVSPTVASVFEIRRLQLTLAKAPERTSDLSGLRQGPPALRTYAHPTVTLTGPDPLLLELLSVRPPTGCIKAKSGPCPVFGGSEAAMASQDQRFKRPSELSVQELATLLQASRNVVYYWVETGIVEAKRRNGGSPYFIALSETKKAELENWVRNSTRIAKGRDS